MKTIAPKTPQNIIFFQQHLICIYILSILLTLFNETLSHERVLVSRL